MAKYAEGTTVAPMKSLEEIRATLDRYGATGFAFAERGGKVGVQFDMKNRSARFTVPLPAMDEFRTVKVGKYQTRQRAPEQQKAAYDQAVRQRWRALLLVIKAKLESVESGIESFEEAFQAQLVLPSGQTVGEWLAPQIEAAYRTGNMPPLLALVDGGGR